jgi:hypothetical protein
MQSNGFNRRWVFVLLFLMAASALIFLPNRRRARGRQNSDWSRPPVLTTGRLCLLDRAVVVDCYIALDATDVRVLRARRDLSRPYLRDRRHRLAVVYKGLNQSDSEGNDR